MTRTFSFLASTALACTVLAGAASAQEFTLRYGHYLGNSPYLAVEQQFADRIAERSDGRIKVEFAYSGALGAGQELLQLAGRGAIDMAAIVPGYYADQLSLARAFQIPFVFDSPLQAIEVSSKSFAEIPAFAEEFGRMNVRVLFQQPLGAYYMTGKTADCTTVDALNGKKVRSFGADIPRAQAAVGIVPVSVAVGEVYEAIDRGTIDYSFLNPGNVLSNRLYEVGRYNCGPVMNFAGHFIVIGNRTWDRLPEDLQTIILEEAATAQTAYVEAINELEEDAIEQITAQGGEFIPIPDEEMAKWVAAAPDGLADWRDSIAAAGNPELATEIYDKWIEWTSN
ncbi:MAG: TRAP transporter substrate-binding protein DctP [Microvirga sp.]|nr:TRAP transporter substrate-binding protein DctP [Microvirga sp.]